MGFELVREHDIFCDGGQIKVTTNLFTRSPSIAISSRARLLWIDAICIDQEAIEERSQQVSLMRDIFQMAKEVLIWMGDERESSRRLSRLFLSLPKYLRVSIQQERKMACGEALVNLTKEVHWAGVMDVLTSRKYFLRLWIIQEIVLSRKAIVICGSRQIS
jgi:hypothetical protein